MVSSEKAKIMEFNFEIFQKHSVKCFFSCFKITRPWGIEHKFYLQYTAKYGKRSVMIE